MKAKKIFTIVAVSGVFAALAFSAYLYYMAFSANTNFNQNEVYVYIPSDATYEMVLEEIKPFVADIDKFDFVAQKRNYTPKSGKYLLKKGSNSFAMVRALYANIPVKVAFNNQETINDLAVRLSAQLEPSVESFEKAFTDSTFLANNNLSEDAALALFIPNTYEFYWNTSAEKVANKLAKEYQKFWNHERLAKAEAKGLTPVEVAILAAIVHKETAKVSERPTVAGVYLNRLATGMPLQADPTVIFAIKKESGNFDQIIKRVFYNDLKINSPYNTYLNTGLPPGLIAMPDISAIDAVLNAPKHDYLYFCASPERPGYHEFASNYAQHQINAKKYSEWVNKLGIER